MPIQLDPRLSLVASFVRQGSAVADIGTDHAYLPVFLVETGRCPRAVASYLRPGPLQNAKQTVLLHGLAEIAPQLGNRAGQLAKAAALWRELESVRCPREQRIAQLLLQTAELLGERGLREIEPLCCLRDAVSGGNLQYIEQLLDRHKKNL